MRSAVMTFALLALLISAGQARADLLTDAIQDYQYHEWAQSEAKLRQLLLQEPDNLMAHYYLGAVLQQEGKADEAIVHYEIVARAPQPIQGIDQALAGAYIAAGKPDKALPYLEKSYRQNRADDNAAFQYAVALQASGRVDEAADIYDGLIRSNSPLADQARFQLGQILTSYGAYASATRTMQAIRPDSPYASAAKSYVEALEPVTRPLNVYASIEGFYNDNPGSSSSAIIGTTTPTPGGSQGVTLIGSLNSRAFEASRHLYLKLGYLYYGTFYRAQAVKQLNFVGHFVNPAVVYKLSPAADIELKGDFQFFFFGGQKLSTNQGGTLTAAWHSADGHSVNLHASYLDKRYTRYFTVLGIANSLEYLDARTTGIGMGVSLAGTALAKTWNGSLTLDYTFNDEKPKATANPDPLIAAKALDSRYREHALRLSASLPLGTGASRYSLLVNANYSWKDYLNLQSGSVYPSAAGQHMKASMLTTGARIQAMLWKKAGLTLGLGMEHTASHSQASELTFKSNRYFAVFSAFY